jgi:protein-tyrosine phosphatase
MEAITRVTVDRDGGDLVVRWEGVTEGAVLVCAGPAPDAIDHGAPAAVVEHGSEARLAGLGTGGRHYVHVGPRNGPGMVAAERLVPLEGTMNFRDLGGYGTDDGRRVRWGRLFRSDGLHALTDADRTSLTAIGVCTVFDLRWQSERDAYPSALPAEGVVVHHLEVGDDTEGADPLERALAGEIDEAPVGKLVEIYERLLEQGAGAFATVLTTLTEDGALPAVFHCTAGKDRTGITAALLLLLLGVPEDDVLDDYELTTVYRSERRIAELRPRFEEAGVDIDRFRAYLSAPRDVLAGALERIESHHGGVEGYLRDGGMAAATPDALRRLLLEDRLTPRPAPS